VADTDECLGIDAGMVVADPGALEAIHVNQLVGIDRSEPLSDPIEALLNAVLPPFEIFEIGLQRQDMLLDGSQFHRIIYTPSGLGR
jgi:hypothetical protein